MASNVGQLQKHDSGQGSSKPQVIILASEWGSSNGWVSTIIRELAIQLATSCHVNITFFLPGKCPDEDKKAASCHGISILEAKTRPGYSELDWLSFPPEDLRIDVVIGHGVKLGHQAQIIRRTHKCKWFQVVDTDAEERGMFQSYENRTSEVEKEHKDEVDLCVMADFVIAIGPKLAEAFRTYLFCYRKSVFELTPGIFDDFDSVQRNHAKSKPWILVFGHGDAEDFKLKGFDIAARSVAALPDTQLMFVGEREKKHAGIVERLVKYGIRESRLKVRGYVDSPVYLKRLFSQVDLVLMPSRTEPFGLIGLQALSAGVPVIVSKNSGFGEALTSVTGGALFVINSEEPRDWTLAIKDILNKDRELQLNEIKTVQDSYRARYDWSKRCKDLFEEMVKCVDGTFSQLDIAAQAVGARELKRNMKFTGLSPCVPPKRKRGIKKNKSEQPAETTQGKRKPKAALENAQQLVSHLENKRMDLTRATLKGQEKSRKGGANFSYAKRDRHDEDDDDGEDTEVAFGPVCGNENLEETVEDDVDEGIERKPKKKRKKKKSKNKQKDKARTS